MKAVGLVRRLTAHELRLLVSIALWMARRSHGTRHGRAFGYAQGQGGVMFAFGFVCVLETIAMAVLLRPWPAIERPVLVLDLYGVLQVVGMHAASVSRPHVLDDTALRIRRAAHIDLRVPLDVIASVRRETRYTHEKRPGELDLAIGAQTTITLELAEPIGHLTFLGRPTDVRLIRFHADEPDVLVQAIREMRTLAPAPRTY
ncbi:hypothetical protein ACFYO0_08820 [Streptomyces sp. NPDC006365]|uniref:hypothetical protein n=1 Tax=Streptomyces sp. NPDC006365 TaxID=3364744 RepID=UPI003686BECB